MQIRSIKFKPDIILLTVMLAVAAILNLQFLDGSNIHYAIAGHDEYLTVREVYTILHPLSFKHFLMAIISGDVLYYGRVMFYTDALMAFLPFKIWGIHGMVYAIRMTHVLLILSGLLILGRTFLIDWKYRMLFYAGTITLYYSAYFFMVPKPEPLQLFLLSVFFLYFKRNGYSFGKWFLFLGLAYGVKFNILTILPLVFIIPFLDTGFTIPQTFKKALISSLYFVAGLLIAVPCLILSPLKPVFFQSYYNSTFANTTQYDDDLTLGATDWILKGWFGAYNGGMIGGILLVTLILVALYYGLKDMARTRRMNNEFLILSVGLLLLVPVILFTGRLWPHYLWTGYIFIFLGLIIFLQGEQLHKHIRLISALILAGVLLGSFKCSYTQGKKLFSVEKNSRELQGNGRKAYQYLKGKKTSFVAMQDLSVPYPFREMLQVNPYNPFASFKVSNADQQFMWMGFITPELLQKNKADFIITHVIDFEGRSASLRTDKDATNAKNNRLIMEEMGKTIFPDTSFGDIKIYSVIPAKVN